MSISNPRVKAPKTNESAKIFGLSSAPLPALYVGLQMECASQSLPGCPGDVRTHNSQGSNGKLLRIISALPTADDNDGPSQHLAQRLGTISVVEMRRALQSLPRSLERRRQYASHFGIKRAVRELF